LEKENNMEKERENTIEFVTNTDSDDVGRLYYQAVNALEQRFNSNGVIQVTIVFVPVRGEDE